jgi:hypothetical protein
MFRFLKIKQIEKEGAYHGKKERREKRKRQEKEEKR